MNWQEQPNAPTQDTYIAHLNDLPDSGIHEVVFGTGNDAFRIMLMRSDNKVQAYLNRCPHFGIRLNSASGDFLILPKRQLMCAVHCAIFTIHDGQCIDGPVKGQHLTKIDIDIDASGEITIHNNRDNKHVKF